MFPDGRTEQYAIWKACERFKIKPPNVQSEWEKNDLFTQCDLIAYSQIRDHEEVQLIIASRSPV